MNTLKVFTAFSGYDSQCMALDRLNIDYYLVGWSEIDKYAIQAHNAVYPQYADRNYGDISKIDWNKVPDFNLFTYSFPCTDISSAGQQKGLTEGSGTRSSLLWECRKTIEIKRPKYLLMENVKALTSDKFMPYLRKWLSFLESMGYSNFTKVLNSKDYGVPQNRERVFVVSILGDERYYFPKPFKLEKRLKDVLESNVDESYYISEKTVNRMIRNNHTNDFCIDVNSVAKTICSSCYKMTTFDNYVSCAMRGRNPDNPSDRTSGIPTEQRIEMGGDVANCLTTVQKDSLIAEPVLRIKQATKLGYIDIKPGSIFDASYPDSNTRRGRVQGDVKISPTLTAQGEPPCYYEGVTQNEIGQKINNTCIKAANVPINADENGLCRTIKSQYYKTGRANFERTGTMGATGVTDGYRIRKLTPRECFRLMGMSEQNIDKMMSAGISKTQLYKMAGNSIVVDVLYYIFKKMFIDKKANKGEQQILFG